MFRPDASVGLRFARTVLVPFGPLIIAIVLGTSGVFSDGSEGVAKLLILVSMAWFFCSLVLVPALLFRADASPGSSSGDGRDGGDDPGKPPSPDPGLGGIPLPDAEQSRERVRDHVRRKPAWLRRRTAREPEQTPAR